MSHPTAPHLDAQSASLPASSLWSKSPIIGAVIGGVVGTRVSARLAPTTTRRVIAVLLAAVAVILVVR